jgi:hypothetical protein
MAAPSIAGKLYPAFTPICHPPGAEARLRRVGGLHMVGGLSIVMFIALVGWGSKYFGWSDPDGHVQLALVTSFILGIIGGFKAKGG